VLPDEHVREVAEQALSVLEDARAGSLVDTPLFAPSVYLAAHKVLAALAGRLAAADAGRLLDHLAPVATVRGGLRTDDAHAAACAAIGAAHPDILDRALAQLIELLQRSPHSLKRRARDLLTNNLALVEGRLKELAEQGSRDAAELLAYAQPHSVDATEAEAAAEALMAPLDSGPGHYSMGTGAVGQSLIAAQLGAKRRARLVREQLRRAQSPYEGALNRSEYLIAAANLATDLVDEDVDELMPVALAAASDPAPSEADGLMGSFSHPLGGMRMGLTRESRPEAVFLAARLARTPEQREQVGTAALRLIGADDDADYCVARALQVLQADLARDLPYLAKQGWALRSFAAIVWAQSTDGDPPLGAALAADPDPRVRRALADALTDTPDERTAAARDLLRIDPRYSVRKRLRE
jgi:hypothetical protein